MSAGGMLHRRPAQILVTFTLALPVMLLGLVLAIDLGNLYLQKRAAQNGADAAALAAARCVAKQWQYAGPAVAPSNASDVFKCRASGVGPNIWTEVARAVNCNQHTAPMTIESVALVGVDGSTPLAQVTGTQNGCPAEGGAPPTSMDSNAINATNYWALSGVRVTIRANVPTVFLGAALAGFGIRLGQAGATGSGDTFVVRATAVAQLGGVAAPTTVTAPVPPFMICGRSGNTWADPAISYDFLDGSGNPITTSPPVGTRFILVGQDAETCGSPTGQAFKGNTDDSDEGVVYGTGATVRVRYDTGTQQSDIESGMAKICGTSAVGTECILSLPLVDCSIATSSDTLCTLLSWGTFKVKYESSAGQNRVSATYLTNVAAPAPSGTVGAWVTFGSPGYTATVIKLSQ